MTPFANRRGRRGKHHSARCVGIVFTNKVLRHPSMMRGPPNRKRRAPSFLVPGRQDIQERFAGTQHPPPVLPNLSEMWKKARGFIGIQETRVLLASNDFADRHRIDPDPVRVIYVRQMRNTVYGLLIERV